MPSDMCIAQTLSGNNKTMAPISHRNLIFPDFM
jgi:hypothetical protein